MRKKTILYLASTTRRRKSTGGTGLAFRPSRPTRLWNGWTDPWLANGTQTLGRQLGLGTPTGIWIGRKSLSLAYRLVSTQQHWTQVVKGGSRWVRIMRIAMALFVKWPKTNWTRFLECVKNTYEMTCLKSSKPPTPLVTEKTFFYTFSVHIRIVSKVNYFNVSIYFDSLIFLLRTWGWHPSPAKTR